MKCIKCGEEMGAGGKTCPYCGYTNIDGEEKRTVITVTPMKWYNFLIYFWLFASAFFGFVAAFNSLFGLFARDPVTDFYYPGMKYVNYVSGVFLLASAALALLTRFALAGYKRIAPLMLMGMYALGFVSSVVTSLMTMVIVHEPVTITLAEIIGGAIGNGVVILLNYIYFNRRKSMFVN